MCLGGVLDLRYAGENEDTPEQGRYHTDPGCYEGYLTDSVPKQQFTGDFYPHA